MDDVWYAYFMRQSLSWKVLGLLWSILWSVGCSTAGPEVVTDLAVMAPVATPTLTALVATAPVAATLPAEDNGNASAVLTPGPIAWLSQTPSQTHSPTATQAVTATSDSTATLTTTPLPSPVPIDRRCPDPAPVKPEYNHFWLSSQIWPTPATTAESHFWLSKPLPGGGRLLTSQILPYGFDGLGRYLLHNGADMSEPMGTPVLAVADGTVIVAQSDERELYGWRCNWYGHLVVIQLDETWQDQPLFAVYGHVLNIVVTPGERVWRGQPVAEVGIGGAAIVPHLHFELRVGENSFDATRNPLLWLSPGETRGVIAGRLIDPEGRPWQGHPVQARRMAEEAAPTATAAGDENTTAEGSAVTAWTYLDDPQHLIHPDEGYAENFVLSDLRPGIYEVQATVQGETYRAVVEVIAGNVGAVEIVTASYKTPTPVAASGSSVDSP